MTQQSNEKTGPSKMAEGIALQRFAESKLPEDRRIFYDPYAKQNPLQAKALAEEYEKKMPGWSNSIRARVRYFDDRIEKAAAEGFTQLVILGAGYDTRAYRIPALKERMTIFEVDHPQTIERKISIITGIFQEMPKHVRFVPLDLEHGDLWDTLKRSGYSTSEKNALRPRRTSPVSLPGRGRRTVFRHRPKRRGRQHRPLRFRPAVAR